MMSDSDIQVFEIEFSEFNAELLPDDSREPGSARFKTAVHRFFERNLRSFAGWYDISVEDDKIRVSWKTAPGKPDALDEIIKKLQKGEYPEGIQLLRFLLPSRENDASVHYNLGMALSDRSELDEAEKQLRKAVQIEPQFTNAKVALGVALYRKGKLREARETLEEAKADDPGNSYALRNLAACLLALKEDIETAEQYLRDAVEILPEDQQAWIGLAQALEAQGKIDEADEAYAKTIDINPHGQIGEMARNARSKIAERTFKERAQGDTRPDAVMYCLSALQRFSEMTRDQVQRCAFEIAALGTKGISVNDPSKKYTLRALEGSFTGLQLLCYEFVGFKKIAPELDIGFDLSKEYRAALQMFEEGRNK
jgi:tetratricopeptide (TPR) repeat protein